MRATIVVSIMYEVQQDGTYLPCLQALRATALRSLHPSSAQFAI